MDGNYGENMLAIALELGLPRQLRKLATKFYEHFVWIASAMCDIGKAHDSMWDEEDGFCYDVLGLPNSGATRLKVRSIVGLLPLCAVTVYPLDMLRQLPELAEHASWFEKRRIPTSLPAFIRHHARVSKAAACWPFWTKSACVACWRKCL